jgi:hypothetical protein
MWCGNERGKQNEINAKNLRWWAHQDSNLGPAD